MSNLALAVVIRADASDLKSEVSSAKVAVETLGQSAVTAGAGLAKMETSLNAAGNTGRGIAATQSAVTAVGQSAAAASVGIAKMEAGLDAVAASGKDAQAALEGVAAAQGRATTTISTGAGVASTTLRQTSVDADKAAEKVRLTANQWQGLGYQINDVATMLSMGASPLQVIASQSGQVIQVLGEGGGVVASLRAIGTVAVEAAAKGTTALTTMAAAGQAAAAAGTAATTSFSFAGLSAGVASLVSKINPAVTVVSAMAAASAYLWYSQRDAANDAEKAVDSYRKAVDDAKVSAGDLGKAIEDAFAKQQNGSAGLVAARVAGSISLQRAALQSGVESLMDIDGLGVSTSTLGALKNLVSLADPAIGSMRELYGELYRGKTTVAEFQESIARIRLDPASSIEAKKLADKLLEASQGARTAESAIEALNAAALNLKGVRFAEFSKQLDDFIPKQKLTADVINNTADAALQQARSMGQVYEIERKRKAGLDELTRVEENRRAGYDLDLRSITARTAAERANIEAERARLAVANDNISETEKAKRVEEARTLSLARSQHELTEAAEQRIRSGRAQVEQLQFEQSLVGKNAAETAQLRAQYELLTAAKEAARQAGTVVDPSEEAAIRSQAEEIGRLTGEMQRLNLERDLRFRVAQAGRSPQEQRIAEEVRSYGEDIETANGKAIAAQLRYVASVEKTADELRATRELGKDTFLDIVDALGSGENAVDGLISALARLGQHFASLGAEKLYDKLFGSRTGDVAKGLGSIGAASAPAYSTGDLGQTFAAPLGRVDRAPLPPLVTGEGFSESRASSVASKSVPAQVWNFFASKGLASHQIAGIMGNAKAESAFNIAADTGDGGKAWGLFQWNDRRHAMVNSVGADWKSDLQGQLNFAWKELQTSESRAYRALLQAKDVTQATEAFLGFERPSGYTTGVRNSHNYSGRVAYAQEAYRTYANGNAPQVASSTNDTRTLARGVSEGMVDADRKIKTSSNVEAYTSGRFDAGTAANSNSSAGSSGLFSQNGFKVLGAGLGSFFNGYESGSPFSGGISGAFGGYEAGGAISSLLGVGAGAGAALGVVGGAALGILGGILGARKKRAEAHKQAAERWEQVRPQYEAFDRSLSGEKQGDLRAYVEDGWSKLSSFMQVGGAAWKNGTGNSTAQFNSTGKKLFEGFLQKLQDFQSGFDHMVEDMASGSMEGSFAKGRSAAKNLEAQYKKTKDDIDISFGNIASIDFLATPDAIKQAEETTKQRADAQKRFDDSAVQYGLSLLYQAKQVSEVQKTIDGLRGTAAGLVPTFQTLGRSAEEAGRLVEDRLNLALGNVRQSLEQNLADEITDLQGKSYLLDVRDLLKEIDGQTADLRLAGGDTSGIGTKLQLRAQDIVNSAELTGEAFDELIARFPQLATVVKAFSADTVQASASDIALAIKGYEERYAAATKVDDLASFERQLAKERVEAAKFGTSALAAFEKAAGAERAAFLLSSARSVLDRSYEAETGRINDLLSARRNEASELESTISGLKSTTSALADLRKSLLVDDTLSILDPKARYEEAQKQFRETLAKAKGGDTDAQAKLSGALQEYMTESRSYNASTEAYYADFREGQRGIDELASTSQAQLSTAESQLAALKAQISVDEAQLQTMKSQYEGILGIKDGIKSFAEAFAAYAAAAAEARKNGITVAGNGGGTSGGTGGGVNGGWGDGSASSYLTKNQDVAAAIAAGQTFGLPAGLSPEAYASAHFGLYGQSEGRKFATGGRVVGPGTATSDSIAAWLSNGEHVTRAGSVTSDTLPVLDHINQTGRVPSADMTIVTAMAPIANDNSVATLLRALREDNAALRAELGELRKTVALTGAAQIEANDQVATRVGRDTAQALERVVDAVAA